MQLIEAQVVASFCYWKSFQQKGPVIVKPADESDKSRDRVHGTGRQTTAKVVQSSGKYVSVFIYFTN